MPYLGNEPGAITDATVDTFTGNGSTTNFTLSQTSDTNSVIVRVHGVVQRNGADFTVSGTTLSFTTAPPDAANNIVAQFFTVGSIQTIADSAVSTQKIADDAVTLAKMAGGTDGNLITFDASGDPAYVATGSSGQLLTSAGAGSPPTFTTVASGGYSFISGVTASSSSEAALTGMESGYDYLIQAYDIIPAADDRSLYMQFGTGSTPSYQSSNYVFGAYGRFNNDLANSFNHENSHGNHQQVKIIAQNAGTGTAETCGFTIQIFNPSDTGSPTFFDGQGFGKMATTQAGVNDIAGFYNADSAVTAAKFYFSSSTNISQGKFFFYRRPNA